MNELLGYFEEEQRRVAPSIPMLAEPVGIFDGVGTALVQSPKHAIDIAAVGLAERLSPFAEEMAERWVGDDFAEWIRGQTDLARQSVKETRSDPAKMGIAANIVHSLGSVVTMGLMGAPLGIVGAATSIGGLSGYDKYLETLEQTKGDEVTSRKVGIVTALTMGIGALLPAFVGKSLSTQIASGIGMNVPLGMAERAGSSAILENAGYKDIAAHYKALDGEAIFIDALLGAMFPIGARALGFTTRHVDAALVAEQGLNQNFRNPGLDTSLEQLDANTKALVEADIQIFAEGRSFENLDLPKMGEQVPNPEFSAVMNDMQARIDNHLLAETGMSRQEWEAYVKGEQDAVQVRISEEMDVREQAGDGEAVAARDAEGKEVAGARKAEEEVTPERFVRDEVGRMAEADPEMKVVDENGDTITAKEMNERLADAERVAKEDAYLYNVAIACARIHGA